MCGLCYVGISLFPFPACCPSCHLKPPHLQPSNFTWGWGGLHRYQGVAVGGRRGGGTVPFLLDFGMHLP